MQKTIYDVATDFSNGVDIGELEEEIVAAGPLPTAGYQGLAHLQVEGAWRVEVLSTIAPTAQEVTDVTTVITAHDPDSLGWQKLAKTVAIDKNTEELISAGFAHSGVTFSLSLEAQINWSSVKSAGAAAALAYPYPVASADDKAYHEFANEAEMITAATTAIGTKEGHISTGGVLKKAVVDAANQADLDAVVDKR